jgi:putative flippase GtrA
MDALLRYFVVGGSALGLHVAVLQGLLLSGLCTPSIASAIGFIVACVLNYSLQRLWVFRSARSHIAAAPRYIAITTAMLCVNTLLFSILYDAGLTPVPAQTITTGGVFLLNFFGSRYITFRAHA